MKNFFFKEKCLKKNSETYMIKKNTERGDILR